MGVLNGFEAYVTVPRRQEGRISYRVPSGPLNGAPAAAIRGKAGPLILIDTRSEVCPEKFVEDCFSPRLRSFDLLRCFFFHLLYVVCCRVYLQYVPEFNNCGTTIW